MAISLIEHLRETEPVRYRKALGIIGKKHYAILEGMPKLNQVKIHSEDIELLTVKEIRKLGLLGFKLRKTPESELVLITYCPFCGEWE